MISDTYKRLNQELHENDPDYGRLGFKYAKAVADICRQNGFTTVLDFGCGKGTLKVALAKEAPKLSVSEYDPAIPGKDKKPTGKFDLVVSTDVLEHIEPDQLQDVIATLQKLCGKAALLEAGTKPAAKTLADGRNAHLTIQPAEWWLDLIGRHFHVMHWQKKTEMPPGVIIFGTPKAVA